MTDEKCLKVSELLNEIQDFTTDAKESRHGGHTYTTFRPIYSFSIKKKCTNDTQSDFATSGLFKTVT
jgi:hypothetical protein